MSVLRTPRGVVAPMGVRHTLLWAPLLMPLRKVRGCDVECTKGRCSSVADFQDIKHRRKSQEKFYIILQHFSPFDYLCHWRALNLTWYRAGRVISDNHIKGTLEHTTRELGVCLGKTSNLTQRGAL